jgi:hypothetical protein
MPGTKKASQADAFFIRSIQLLQGNSAFHHRDVAWEGAEETIGFASSQFRYVEGH